LLPECDDWAALVAKLGMPVTMRAEELNLEQWLTITHHFDDHPLKEIPQKGSEVFDVVDENDQVVGRSTRAEIHASGTLHRAVHIFVFNKRRDLLLQLRSRWKDNHPGVWDSSAAGHLDAGEDYHSCAVRELQEELGIEKEALIEIGKISPCKATGWEFVTLYAAQYQGALRFPCSEIDAVQWFPIPVIEDWLKNRPSDFATGLLILHPPLQFSSDFAISDFLNRFQFLVGHGLFLLPFRPLPRTLNPLVVLSCIAVSIAVGLVEFLVWIEAPIVLEIQNSVFV
jgi:16S rRNA (adenine1518-N6/adenine1519-N6)-dimethyltransferase